MKERRGGGIMLSYKKNFKKRSRLFQSVTAIKNVINRGKKIGYNVYEFKKIFQSFRVISLIQKIK